jgi:FdhD protein
VVTSSSCGVCGSASIEAVHLAGHPELTEGLIVPLELLSTLLYLLRSRQRASSSTGGLHGVAPTHPDGESPSLDKTRRRAPLRRRQGHRLVDVEGKSPLSDMTLIVSGGISFEVVQKALRTRIPIAAAVSVVTSSAVRLAEDARRLPSQPQRRGLRRGRQRRVA